MSRFKTSYIADSKVLRVPQDVKDALDSAKPAGIELWKFASDMIMLGLAVSEELKQSNKDLESISQYETVAHMRDSLKAMMGAKSKASKSTSKS